MSVHEGSQHKNALARIITRMTIISKLRGQKPKQRHTANALDEMRAQFRACAPPPSLAHN